MKIINEVIFLFYWFYFVIFSYFWFSLLYCNWRDSYWSWHYSLFYLIQFHDLSQMSMNSF